MSASPRQSKSPAAPVLRTQRWALHAYDVVAGITDEEQQRDYRIAINDLGANILRSGLLAAISAVQRKAKHGCSATVFDHITAARLSGMEDVPGPELPQHIRTLDTDGYIMATYEMLELVSWLKRAVQATFGDQ